MKAPHRCPGHHPLSCGIYISLVKLSFLKKSLFMTSISSSLQASLIISPALPQLHPPIPSRDISGKDYLCDRSAKTPYAGHGHDEESRLVILPLSALLPLRLFFIDPVILNLSLNPSSSLRSALCNAVLLYPSGSTGLHLYA